MWALKPGYSESLCKDKVCSLSVQTKDIRERIQRYPAFEQGFYHGDVSFIRQLFFLLLRSGTNSFPEIQYPFFFKSMLWNSGAQITNNGPEEVLYDNANDCCGGVKSTVLTIAQQEPLGLATNLRLTTEWCIRRCWWFCQWYYILLANSTLPFQEKLK